MPQIRSQIDLRSPDFQANAAQLRETVEDLRKEMARVAQGGGEKARIKHTERGSSLPRFRGLDVSLCCETSATHTFQITTRSSAPIRPPGV